MNLLKFQTFSSENKQGFLVTLSALVFFSNKHVFVTFFLRPSFFWHPDNTDTMASLLAVRITRVPLYKSALRDIQKTAARETSR